MHTATASSQARPHSRHDAGHRVSATATPGSATKPKLDKLRHSERSLLYQTIAEQYATWLELASAGQFDGQGEHHTPKPYGHQAFRKYLECGSFAHDFARARYMVLRIFLRSIAQSLQSYSPGAANVNEAALHIGAVALFHQFGSSQNEQLHFQVCAVDGVFEEVAGEVDADIQGSPPGAIFHPVSGIDETALARRRPPCASASCAPSWAGACWRALKPKTCWPSSEPMDDKRGAKIDELSLTPLELIARIAALVPPPRTHRHRYFGVLPPKRSPAHGPPLWDNGDAQMADGAQIEPDWATDWDGATQPAPDDEVGQRVNG